MKNTTTIAAFIAALLLITGCSTTTGARSSAETHCAVAASCDSYELDQSVAIHFEEVGDLDRHAIIFIHGLGSSHIQFQGQMEYFSGRYHAIAVDLRGHGVSPGNDGPFTLDDYTRDIAELINDLNVEKPTIVGNSLGGLIGLNLAKEYPDLVSGVATFGTTYSLSTPTWSLPLLSLSYRLLPDSMTVSLAARLNGQTADSKTAIRKSFRFYNSNVSAKTVPHIANYSFVDVVQSTAIPILLIQGGKDTAINKELTASLSAIRNSQYGRIAHIASAGHFANLDAATEFNDIVEDFVSELQRPDKNSHP